MSKAEILDELPKLTREERREVVAKARELDGADWVDPDVTADEQRILDAELKEFEKDPDTGSKWDEVGARIRRSGPR